MISASRLRQLAAGLFMLPLATTAFDGSDVTGEARDPKSGALLYLEINRFEVADGRLRSGLVRYRDPGGQLFAERRLDFGADLFVPDFHTRRFDTGFEEGLRRQDGQLELRYRPAAESRLRVRLIDPPEGPAAADDGLVPFVMSRMAALLRGEDVRFRFIAPSYRGRLQFTATRVADRTRQGRTEHVIRIDIGGPLIRLFTDPILLSFDAATGRYVEYRGLSNLRDGEGDTWPVVIRYPLPDTDAASDTAAPPPPR